MDSHQLEHAEAVISRLKAIDVDGETMQYILEKVGMEYQMHRQLIMTAPADETLHLLEEKIELDKTLNRNHEN